MSPLSIAATTPAARHVRACRRLAAQLTCRVAFRGQADVEVVGAGLEGPAEDPEADRVGLFGGDDADELHGAFAADAIAEVDLGGVGASTLFGAAADARGDARRG